MRNENAAATRLIVRKLRPDGSQAFAWDAELLRADAEGFVLAASFNIDMWQVGGTTLTRGDAFREFYYHRRWYNVFQVSGPEGALKGWYCNVGTPPRLDRERAELSYVDLALDLWVEPGGRYVKLDEEEFEQHRVAGDWPAELIAGAERGWTELLELARRGELPRWVDG